MCIKENATTHTFLYSLYIAIRTPNSTMDSLDNSLDIYIYIYTNPHHCVLPPTHTHTDTHVFIISIRQRIYMVRYTIYKFLAFTKHNNIPFPVCLQFITSLYTAFSFNSPAQTQFITYFENKAYLNGRSRCTFGYTQTNSTIGGNFVLCVYWCGKSFLAN